MQKNTALKTVWIISKYGSPKEYGLSSKPYRTAKFFSEHGINTYLITSDSNHLADYPSSNQTYNTEKLGKLQHIWIRTLTYKKSASYKRILSWFAFEWHLYFLDRRRLERPDVVIISSLSLLTILYGVFLKRLYGCKLVFEVRDIYPLTLTEELGISACNPLVLLLKFVEKLGYRRADLIVGTIPNLRSHVQKVLGYTKDVFFSPLGVREIWTNPIKPSEEIDKLFPSNGRVVVGYAGSIGRTNALDRFVEAIKELKDYPCVHFVLVGDGDKKEKYVEDLQGCPNVTIGPRIEEQYVPYFLSKCDILYLSTHNSVVWEYGQSMNKLVDYMMAGKPVIASYGGYPSMLNEAESGVFIPPNSTNAIIDAIRFYVEMDVNERNMIGLKGRHWIVDNYSNDVVCNRYLERLCALVTDKQ